MQGSKHGIPAGPVVDWLLREAWRIGAPKELIKALCHRLREVGIAVERLNCHLPFLDPQVVGVSYPWTAQTDTVTEVPVPFEMRLTPTFAANPMAPIVRGETRVLRRALTGPSAELDFPLLEELAAAGMTGYIIFAVPFANGAINALSLATAAPGGFDDGTVAALEGMLPALGRILEIHALNRLTASLLETYVGRRTGREILGGRIRRGDLVEIDAIMWFSDLRGSTRLAADLPPRDFLAALNASFDATAGAVMAAGGEVLKFIGDAVLAIFPTEDGERAAAAAAVTALEASAASLAAMNAERTAAQAPALNCGVALHRGLVMYGNVGVPHRLDFTVTGPAVNTAARLQELCRDLGETVLVSADVAGLAADRFEPLGRHRLRSIDGAMEIFRPARPHDRSLVQT